MKVIPIAQSSCERAWGQCLRDPRCKDTACPGHPTATCSTCKGGPCPTPLACQVPLAEVPRRIERPLFLRRQLLPVTPEGWGRFIQGGIGGAGLAYLAVHAARHFGGF